MNKFLSIISVCAVILLVSCAGKGSSAAQSGGTDSLSLAHKSNPYYSHTDTAHLNVSDAQWKKILPHDVYLVAREKDTEPAFTGKYVTTDEKGTYYCAVCGNALFKSDAKFSSECGWPSFYEPIRTNSVIYLTDDSYGMHRTEVQCGRCNSHLGHIFDDGPPPTHKRFCMNSVVLDFVADGK